MKLKTNFYWNGTCFILKLNSQWLLVLLDRIRYKIRTRTINMVFPQFKHILLKNHPALCSHVTICASTISRYWLLWCKHHQYSSRKSWNRSAMDCHQIWCIFHLNILWYYTLIWKTKCHQHMCNENCVFLYPIVCNVNHNECFFLCLKIDIIYISSWWQCQRWYFCQFFVGCESPRLIWVAHLWMWATFFTCAHILLCPPTRHTNQPLLELPR